MRTDEERFLNARRLSMVIRPQAWARGLMFKKGNRGFLLGRSAGNERALKRATTAKPECLGLHWRGRGI